MILDTTAKRTKSLRHTKWDFSFLFFKNYLYYQPAYSAGHLTHTKTFVRYDNGDLGLLRIYQARIGQNSTLKTSTIGVLGSQTLTDCC